MRPSRFATRSRLLAGALLVAALTGGLSLATRGAAGDQQAPATGRTDGRSVGADELWREGLRTMACFEEHGVRTIGPVPAADGAGTEYSIALGPTSEEAQALCTATYEPLARQFALDNEPPGGRGQAPRTDRTGVDRMLAIRAAIVRCLGLPEPADAANDATVAAAAHGRPSEFRTCAERTG